MRYDGLILFGHGARDPRWREPFDRLAAMLTAQLPDTPVRLAFLELMAPDLAGAVAELAAHGATRLQVIPVFFGQGGHLRRDLPALIAATRDDFPEVAIDCADAVGEDEAVLAAIAAYCRRTAGLA